MNRLIWLLLVASAFGQYVATVPATKTPSGNATFTLLGTNSSLNSSTTFTIPVSAGTSSSASVVVGIAMQLSGGTPTTISSCTDNATGGANTYNLDKQANNTTDGYTVGILTSNFTHAIPSSSGTITCTISSATAVFLLAGAYTVSSPQFSGGTFLDGTPGSFATQGATSGTATASTASANDIAITAWIYKTSDTLTVTSGYTSFPSIPITGNGRGLQMLGKLVSSGGAVAATGTLNSADDMVGVVAGYKHP